MAQYPQGIFQSLQWLLKKVKVLALAKQPVYNIGSIATGTTYTIQGRGVYAAVSAGTGKIAFPDPALYQGQTIMLIAVTGLINIDATYAPVTASGTLTATAAAGTYTFVSNGVIWYGGKLA